MLQQHLDSTARAVSQALVPKASPAVVAASVIAAPFVLTYALTYLNLLVFHAIGKSKSQPSPVLYSIPWLGNFPSFILDSKRYQLALQ